MTFAYKVAVEIRQDKKDRPNFSPGGETLAEVGSRADRIIARVRRSADILRVLAARWLGLDPSAGQFFLLSTGA